MRTIRGIAISALCAIAVGCTATPAASQGPARAEASEGSYKLTFDLPKTTWSTTEAITETATLSFSGAGGVDLWSSGMGPIGFGFVEIGGTKMMGPAWTADCHQQSISSAEPIDSPIKKSGAFNGEDANVGFYRSFFSEEAIHLPAGDWTIEAVANFYEGSCGGAPHNMKAKVQLHITG